MIEELLQRRRAIDAAHVELWSEWTPELLRRTSWGDYSLEHKKFIRRDFALHLQRIELIKDAKREGLLEQVVPES